MFGRGRKETHFTSWFGKQAVGITPSFEHARLVSPRSRWHNVGGDVIKQGNGVSVQNSDKSTSATFQSLAGKNGVSVQFFDKRFTSHQRLISRLKVSIPLSSTSGLIMAHSPPKRENESQIKSESR